MAHQRFYENYLFRKNGKSQNPSNIKLISFFDIILDQQIHNQNLAEKNKKKLNELKIEEIKKIEPKLNNDIFKVFDLKYSINSKNSFGGTSFANIKKMIRSYKKDI